MKITQEELGEIIHLHFKNDVVYSPEEYEAKTGTLTGHLFHVANERIQALMDENENLLKDKDCLNKLLDECQKKTIKLIGKISVLQNLLKNIINKEI